MPTAQETELAIQAFEDDFPDEATLLRRRLTEISEERPMHAWLREVVEAIHESSTATREMRETLDRLVPGISSTNKYVEGIHSEEKKRNDLLAEQRKQTHALELHEADTWRSFVDGAVTMGTTAVKHPAFWSAVTAIVTWLAMTYGLPLPETPP